MTTIHTDTVPAYCNYLTAGKRYETSNEKYMLSELRLCEIVDDNDNFKVVAIHESAHLNGGSWIVEGEE